MTHRHDETTKGGAGNPDTGTARGGEETNSVPASGGRTTGSTAGGGPSGGVPTGAEINETGSSAGAGSNRPGGTGPGLGEEAPEVGPVGAGTESTADLKTDTSA